jgi:hypothetical protein
MQTITIYEVQVHQGFSVHEQGSFFGLEGYNNGGYPGHSGSDDGGRPYEIPDGYSVKYSKDTESLALFVDKTGEELELVNDHGRPCFAGLAGQIFAKKLQTVTIYKIEVMESYQMDERGTCYSLEPWSGDNIDYKGRDDGGKLYILPKEYEVAENNMGTRSIYRRDNGQHVDLTGYKERPALVDITGGETPYMLKDAR